MTRAAYTSRHTIRLATAVGTLAAVGALHTLPAMVPSAAALPFPMSPSDPAVADQWANPMVRGFERSNDVALEILSISGEAHPGDEVQVDVRVRNDGADDIDALTLTVQRQAAVTDPAAARNALAADQGDYPYYATSLQLEQTLERGRSTEATLTIPTSAWEEVTLAITDPGVYPVSVGLTGSLGLRGVAFLDSQRFLLPVTDPDTGAISNTAALSDWATDVEAVETTDTSEPTEISTGISMVYPLSAPVDVLGGETGDAPEDAPLVLRSDDLATELESGGRLDQLLNTWTGASDEVRAGSCLALDPQLIDAVDRMADGYSVGDERVSTARQSQRLRDLWTASRAPDEGVAGTGSQAATAWLGRLRETAVENCTVALPWANADLNAVQTTGNQWLMREAIERGPETIAEVLGVEPVTNVVIPGSGYVTEPTARGLGWADTTRYDAATGAPAATQPGSGDVLENAWEVQSTPQGAVEGPTGDGSGGALDEPTVRPDPSQAPEPLTDVSVLVADNTVWDAPSADRFSELAPGIRGVSFQGSLAATLAASANNPLTVGYSNPESRFDYTLDSAPARQLSAQASLRLTAADNADPVLVMPPAQLDSDTATTLVNTTQALLDADQAQPLAFTDYLTPDPEQQAELNGGATQAQSPTNGASTSEQNLRYGAPFDDPSAVTDTEILRVSQQANYTDDLTRLMVNDPAIVLTRYGFTAPLRQDLLRAMTVTERRSMRSHDDVVAAADRTLNDNRRILQQLRTSVVLVPPGNVYTRTTASSPLLIVAQNGLPLPVETLILYSGPEDAHVNTPGVVNIPARGSLTLQMTADLPDDTERTDLEVWMASPDGAAISDPVGISVQPRIGLWGAPGLSIVLMVALAGLLLVRVVRARRRQVSSDAYRRPRDPSSAAPITPATQSTSRSKRRGSDRSGGHADESTGSPKPPGNN